MSEQVSQLLESLKAKAERGELLYIGENVVRVDSLEKVLGIPVYTADLIPRELSTPSCSIPRFHTG